MPRPQTNNSACAKLTEQIRTVDGWLRDAQAEMLWSAAEQLGPGSTIVEIGSFHGKSTIVLATAAPTDARIFAIDPHAGNDRDPGQWEGTADDGIYDHQQFTENLRRHGVLDRVAHVRQYSHNAHGDVDGLVELLYVDGAHGYAPALDDLTTWGNRVPIGGQMIIHDVYNSFFVSLAVIRRLWFSRGWRKVDRTTSMARYERRELCGSAYVRSILTNVVELPHFLRNMTIKALRAGRIERAAVLLGHHAGDRLY